jgi:hypothetical protein
MRIGRASGSTHSHVFRFPWTWTWGNPARVDTPALAAHYFGMSTLAEIEKAAQALSPQQKRKLISFLGAQLQADSRSRVPRDLPPGERAAEFRRWAGAHEPGPGLPDSAVGREAIYD